MSRRHWVMKVPMPDPVPPAKLITVRMPVRRSHCSTSLRTRSWTVSLCLGPCTENLQSKAHCLRYCYTHTQILFWSIKTETHFHLHHTTHPFAQLFPEPCFWQKCALSPYLHFPDFAALAMVWEMTLGSISISTARAMRSTDKITWLGVNNVFFLFKFLTQHG